MSDKLTLHLALHSTVFREAVYEVISEKAEVTREAFGTTSKGQAATLRNLAEHVRALNHESQPLYTLYVIAKADGRYREGGEYEPSPNEKKILGNIGTYPALTPTAAVSLEEMAAGAVANFIENQDRRVGEAVERWNQAADEIRQLEERVADRDEVAEKLGVAERTLERAEAERRKLTAQVEELRERLVTAPEKPRKADWKAIESYTGVYGKEQAEGLVYGIKYPNPEKPGAVLTETVGTDLDEAVALREERVKANEKVEVAA
jgi:hypothetical protein